jgi:pimeloyl-ACP methyl ester carboxylesterase
MAQAIISIPGLLSDRRVFEPCSEFLSDYSWTHFQRSDECSLSQWGSEVASSADEPSIFFGHSMGARVALEAWRLAPERCSGLILADFGVDGLVTEQERAGRERRVRLASEVGMEALIDDWLRPMVAPSFVQNPGFSVLSDMLLNENSKSHERQIQALLDRPDAATYLGSINIPVLLLVGEDDAWSPVAQHQAIADELACSQLTVIEGAGHFLPFEKPYEVAQVIERWVSQYL